MSHRFRDFENGEYTYDGEVNASYVKVFNDDPDVTDTVITEAGVAIDVNKAGEIVGVEILH